MGVEITDTTLRDAHQSLLATRMRPSLVTLSEAKGLGWRGRLPSIFFAEFILSRSRFFATLRMTRREGLRMTGWAGR